MIPNGCSCCEPGRNITATCVQSVYHWTEAGVLLISLGRIMGQKMEWNVVLLSDKFPFAPQVSLPMLLIKSLIYHCHAFFHS